MIRFLAADELALIYTNPLCGDESIAQALDALGLDHSRTVQSAQSDFEDALEAEESAFVFRDPYHRAVSMYLRFCETTESRNAKKRERTNKILRELGKESEGITFLEFLRYLRDTPEERRDIHYLPQAKPDHPGFLIRAEQLIPGLVQYFGLKGIAVGSATKMKKWSRLAAKNVDQSANDADTIELLISDIQQLRHTKGPPACESFLDQRNRKLIEEVFREDVDFFHAHCQGSPVGLRRYRPYPAPLKSRHDTLRPVSFVVVWFSDDYFHNLFQSECVHHPRNQLVTIDNRKNVFFDNLSEAINAGIEQAEHELVVIVHEDVLLTSGWQDELQRSMEELEKHDPEWGLLGAAGWDQDGEFTGHCSDPGGYRNTFKKTRFSEVERIDEQLMIISKSSGVELDPLLPSIHNIGKDLARTLSSRKQNTYVIDAPTIHKFADESGSPILSRYDSSKIVGRKHPAYLADLACSDDYIQRKWFKQEELFAATPSTNSPIILLARGGSGSRLLSVLASDLGIFLGNDLNVSGDSMEIAQSFYKALLNKHLSRAEWQRKSVVPDLLASAGTFADQDRWGFKLPESMLLVPELDQAFPNARYIHLIRDPLDTCLRRTHMTARFDNPIGRAAIREAYRYLGIDLVRSLEDFPALHMAYTTIHQVESVLDYASASLDGRYCEVRFEDLLADPQSCLATVADWLGVEAAGEGIVSSIDPARAAHPKIKYPAPVKKKVKSVLHPLRSRLGYVE